MDQFPDGFHDHRAIAQREEIVFGDGYLDTKPVTHRHLHQRFSDAAIGERPGRHDLAAFHRLAEEGPVGLQLVCIGHPVGKRRMPEHVDPVSGFLEFRGDDGPGIHRRNAEGDEGGRDMDMLEGAAHGVLAADGGEAQLLLHLDRSQERAQRLAPGMRVVGHPLEVFLVGEAHAGPVGTGAGHFRAGLDDGVGRTVVRAPDRKVRVVAEGHDAGRIGITVHRKLLYGNLRLGKLTFTAVRHEHRGTAHGRVEHLHEPLLGSDVRGSHDGEHLLRKGLSLRRTHEGILVLHGQDLRLRIMLRTGTVDEFAGKVAHLHAGIEHPHPAGIRNIGHMGHFDVIGPAEGHEALFISRFHDDGHTLMGLADGEFRRIEASILRGDAIQVDVQSPGEFADGDGDAAGAEVVRFLDETRHLRTAEKPLELALFGSVSFLNLAAASFQGRFRMLLGRACRSPDAVPAGTASQQEDHVTGRRAFPPDGRGLHRTHDSTDLHAFGGITVGIDFPDMRRREADLVAVAGVAGGRLLADHPLRKLAGNGIRHTGRDVAGTGDTHRLIDIGATGKRVADRAAQAGGRTAERFDFRGVVMRFVLELQEPFLRPAIDLDIHENAAGVVLLALFQVVQLALLAQPAGADRGKLHQAAGLVLPAEVRAHLLEQAQGLFQLGFHEGFVHRDFLQFGGEGRVAAMVAPVGIQDPEFRLGRIPSLSAEVTDHLGEVVGIHRETMSLAEGGVIGRGHVRESGEVLQRLHVGLLAEGKDGKVLFAAFHRIDEIVADPLQGFLVHRVVEDEQAGTLDFDVRGRIDQVDAVHGRGGPLVELARDVLHGDVLLSFQGKVVGDGIGHDFAEHAVAGLFEEPLRETEKVIHVDEPERSETQGEVLVELGKEARRFHAEPVFLFYENASAVHGR